MIRYYEENEIDQIAKIIDEDWKITYKGMISQEYLDNLNYKDREERIRKKYKKEKGIVYVEENIVKGYCRFGQSKEEKELGEIYALYVKNNYIRRKIGEKLMKKAKKILKEREYKEMILWCLEKNKNARKFYEKQGGILSGKRKFKIGDKYYSEVSYKYEL